MEERSAIAAFEFAARQVRTPAVVVRGDGTLVFANQAAHVCLGRPPSVHGLRFEGVYPWAKSTLESALAQARAGDGSWRARNMRDDSGQAAELTLTLLSVADDGRLLAGVIQTDAGASTGIAPEIYRDFFQELPFALNLYEWQQPPDPGSMVLRDTNPAAAVMSGVDVTRFHEMRISEAFPDLMATEVPAKLVAAHGGTKTEFELEYGDEHFERRTYKGHCFAVSGAFVGEIFENVTERRRLQAANQQQLAELQEKNADLDGFTRAVAHDLKAPLRAVRNLSDWLVEDLGDGLDKTSGRHLQTMRQRVERMDRLLDDLLEYAEIGRRALPSERLRVSTVFEHIVHELDLGQRLQATLDSDVQDVFISRVPLEQVLRNLVDNAVRHHDCDVAHVTVRVREHGERMRIEVEDDGPGIAPEYRERIFEIFQTLSPKGHTLRTGIGLALVRRLVERHGGSISVAAASPRGARVVFDWPRQAGQGEGRNGGAR